MCQMQNSSSGEVRETEAYIVGRIVEVESNGAMAMGKT